VSGTVFISFSDTIKTHKLCLPTEHIPHLPQRVPEIRHPGHVVDVPHSLGQARHVVELAEADVLPNYGREADDSDTDLVLSNL